MSKKCSYTYTQYSPDVGHERYWVLMLMILELLDPKRKQAFGDPYAMFLGGLPDIDLNCCLQLSIDPEKPTNGSCLVQGLTDTSVDIWIDPTLVSINVDTPQKFFKKYAEDDPNHQVQRLIRLLHKEIHSIVPSTYQMTDVINQYLDQPNLSSKIPGIDTLSDTFVTLYSNSEILLESLSSEKLIRLIDCVMTRSLDHRNDRSGANPVTTGEWYLGIIRKAKLIGSKLFTMPKTPLDADDFYPGLESDEDIEAFYTATEKLNAKMGYPGRHDNSWLAQTVMDLTMDERRKDSKEQNLLIFQPAEETLWTFSDHDLKAVYVLLYVLNRAAFLEKIMKEEQPEDISALLLDRE